MTIKKYLLVVLTGLCLFHANAQKIKEIVISGNTSAMALTHQGELPPMWQVARQEGRWNHLEGGQVLGVAAVGMTAPLAPGLSFNGQAEMDYNQQLNGLYLHTGWAGFQWKGLSVKAGKHLFAPIFRSPYSGSGSYLFGDNNQPISRVTLEIADYVTLPLLGDKLEVRGGISQGWLNEDRGPYGNSNVLLHEKYGYLRWKGQKWRPYLGLNHSSLFGGTLPNGQKIPVDFLATFFAHGSDKISVSEAANAAGAHMGLFDFGVHLNTSRGPVQIYYQIPFSDGSGMFFFHHNTDHVAGINWNPGGNTWLTNLTLEWIQTTYQSGNGMPDPGAVVNGEYISLSRILYEESTTEFMYEQFGINQDSWTWEEVKQVLKERVNHGNEFAGRDGYMNNTMYPGGWLYQGQVMGNPLNLTLQQLFEALPGWTSAQREAIGNDRFNALHIGGEGCLIPQLKWNARLTYSRNFGSYYGQYPGRYTWDEADNYWFKGGKTQWYTLLGFRWTPPRMESLSIMSSIAFDAGDIYQSEGVMVGVTYALP